MKFLKLFFILILLTFNTTSSKAEVRFADIFSSHMVLQRNIDLKIWGYANPGEKLTLNFNNKDYKIRANKDGKWEITLKPISAGGPYQMSVEGENKITLKDILIGDVWVCSGQSNMLWTVANSDNSKNEIANANYSNIRLFSVPLKISAEPITEMPNTSWEVCSSETIGDFSAVGYFFGRDIHLETGVPVGLIKSAWGGTCVETWTSKESITKLSKYEDFDKKIESFNIEEERNKKKQKLRSAIGEFPNGETGIKDKWMLPETDRTNWSSMEIPNFWENIGYDDLDGIVWFSYDFDLTTKDPTGKTELHLGVIDDSDIVWINGVKVGETNWGFNKNRMYTVPNEVIKSGKNNITIRVQDRRNKGGFGATSKDFFLQNGKERVSLSGKWKFKVDEIYDNFDISPNELPSLLYNAMINPLIPFGIKGVIWYQGENNARRAKEYATTFPNLINNWRQDWQQGDFPFLFVQLANFGAPSNNPTNSNWAELRESQTKTLDLKNTGMALAIDLGEAYNIHPKNKQDVGKRLSLAALKVAYNKDIVYSGPQYKSMKIKNDKAILSFNYVGSGFEIKDKDSEIQEFEIAGKNKKFYSAFAKIDGDKIIVWSNEVKEPVEVRFAWANNPAKFNLYNKEGLPAIPFRTDNWEGVTDGKSFDD